MYEHEEAGRYDHIHGDENDGYEYDERDWDMVDLGELDD